jgi:hypothetical protein
MSPILQFELAGALGRRGDNFALGAMLRWRHPMLGFESAIDSQIPVRRRWSYRVDRLIPGIGP